MLEWHTDLGAAIADARRTHRPILSLRLLGRLDQELSCANSRFFRRTLYPEPRIHRVLRERFVLHWQSLRPVPLVTIDFGNGKKITKTLTGNSVHLVLDSNGQPVDALPGLVTPDVFLQQLEIAHGLANVNKRQLAAAHERLLALPPPRIQPSRAVAASQLAPTKHFVEAPVLRAVSPPLPELDTAINLELHQRIHAAFASGMAWTIDALVAWIYEELFAMPPDDPFLGLDVTDPV